MHIDILSKFLDNFIEDLYSNVKSTYKDISDEIEFFIKRSLKVYLSNKQKQFIQTKTILFRARPINFYETYYPINIWNNENNIDTKKVENIFEQQNKIIVFGIAGSGKSMLARHVFLNSIANEYKIPIFLELRNIDYQEGIFKFLIKILIIEEYIPNEEILTRLLEKGKFIIILDGFDELKMSKSKEAIIAINSFTNKFPKNNFVLTSRPYTGIDALEEFTVYHVSSLDNEDILNFVEKQPINQELKPRIIETINSLTYYENYYGILDNPLLLSLYILTYSSFGPQITGSAVYYRRIIDVLFKEHDGLSKIGYDRELKSNLGQRDVEKVLEMISYLSFFEGKVSFTREYILSKKNMIQKVFSEKTIDLDLLIDDLLTSICIFVLEGLELKFIHRSVQEYFAAIFVSKMEASKKEFYSNFIELFKEGVYSENFSFANICKDIDEIGFKRYFAKPVLEKIFKNIKFEEELSDEKIIDLYLDIAYFDSINKKNVSIRKDFVYLDEDEVTEDEMFNNEEIIFIRPGFSEKNFARIIQLLFSKQISQLSDVIITYKILNNLRNEYSHFYLVDEDTGEVLVFIRRESLIDFLLSSKGREIFHAVRKLILQMAEYYKTILQEVNKNDDLVSSFVNLIKKN